LEVIESVRQSEFGIHVFSLSTLGLISSSVFVDGHSRTWLCVQVLFENAQLLVERGEKLAVIGPNGCGKSTLLRMLMGTQKATSGEISLGAYRVVPNYFEQNQVRLLLVQFA